MDKIVDLYRKYTRKYRRSFAVYVSISIISFLLAAVVVILNLFAIRYNPGRTSSDDSLKTAYLIFVIIAIITACQGFVAGLISLLTFKNKITHLKAKHNLLKAEIKIYKDNKNKQSEQFIERIKEILSEFK